MKNEITLSEANANMRIGSIEKAIEIYKKLYKKNPLDLYIKNIEYAKRKLNNNKKTKVLKILYITLGLQGPSLGGGIGTCFRSMIEISGEHGYEADVLYLADPYYGRENKKYWVEFFEEKNIGFHTPEPISVYGTKEMKRAYQVLEFSKKNQHKYNAIIYHDYQGIGYYLAIGRFYGNDIHIPVIAWCHGNTRLSMHFGNKSPTDYNDTAILYMESKSVEFADIVITPSIFYKKWWEEITQRCDIQVLKNYIHFNTKKREKKESRIQQKTVAFYGRLEILKGLKIFIDAIKKIKETEKSNANIKYIFAGNPTLINGVNSENYIEDRLTGFDISYEIILNPQPNEFFTMLNSVGGYCVFPTLGETSSCVIIESIHNGVAFIASDIDPIRELVKESDHKAVLFKTGCYESLAESIISFNNNQVIAGLKDDMFSVKGEWGKFFTSVFMQNVKDANFQQRKISIAIIIPTSDRPELLEQTLASIQAQTSQAEEVIVIDDNSLECIKNKEITEKLNFKYIYSTHKIYKGAAINLASEYVNSEILLFFDDDDLANSDMVKTCRDFFSIHNDCHLLSWFADVFDHKNGPSAIDYTSLALGDDLTTNIQSNFFGKGSFAVRLNAFKYINGYDVDDGPLPMVDYRFYLKSQLNKLKLVCIPKSLYKYRKNSPKSLYYAHAGSDDNMYLSKKKVAELISNHSANITKDLLDVLVHNHFQPKYKPTLVEKKAAEVKHTKWFEKSSCHIKISPHCGKEFTIDIHSSNGEQIIQLIQILDKSELLVYTKNKDSWNSPDAISYKSSKVESIFLKINASTTNIVVNDVGISTPTMRFWQHHFRKVVCNEKFIAKSMQ